MPRHTRFLLAVATTVTVLTFAGSVSANKLSVNATRQRIVFTPISILTSGGNIINCNVTIEQGFHSATLAKVAGSLIGVYTQAANSPCTGGRVTIHIPTLPWHMRYSGFGGTLPNINIMYQSILGLSARIQPTGSIACTMRSTVENPARFAANVSAGGATRSLRADETAGMPLEGFFCAFGGEAFLRGTGTITRSGTTVQDVTTRLI